MKIQILMATLLFAGAVHAETIMGVGSSVVKSTQMTPENTHLIEVILDGKAADTLFDGMTEVKVVEDQTYKIQVRSSNQVECARTKSDTKCVIQLNSKGEYK